MEGQSQLPTHSQITYSQICWRCLSRHREMHMKILTAVLAIVTLVVVAFDDVAVAALE